MSVRHPQATHRTIAAVRDAFVGRTEDGARVFVSIEVQHVTAETPRETTGHELVTEWDEVSITQAEIEKGRRSQDSGGAGIGRAAQARTVKGTSWTDADRASLAELAGWHLSSMNAGCDHVAAVYEVGRYGRQPSLTLTPACTEPVERDGETVPNGYRYGHAWLIRPLPAGVRDELARLAAIPAGDAPEWLRTA